MRTNVSRLAGLRLLAAVVAAAVVLPSCGGSSAHTMPAVRMSAGPGLTAGTNIVQVTTSLPAGAPAVSTLSLTNSFASVRPSSAGAFPLPISTEGPQYAELDDPNGKAVALGFVGPQTATMNATSTAKVLVFFAASFYQVPNPYRSQLVDGVASDPGFPAVVSAVTAAMAVGGVGSAAGATIVAPALQTFVTAFYASTSPSAAARMAKRFTRTPQDVLVAPSNETSGITTINDFPDGVHFQNAYRRLATAFIDEVSPRAVTDVVPPVQIPAVNGFGNVAGTALAALQAFNGGTGVYTPVSTSSVPLPLEPGSAQTTYNVTVVGAGLPTGAALTSEQSTAQVRLVAQQLVQDYLVPIVCSLLLPVADTRIDTLLNAPGANPALADLVSAVAAVPGIISLTSSGDLGGALTMAWTTVLGSNQLQNVIIAIAYSVSGALGASSAQIAAYKLGTNLLVGLNILSGALVAVDIAVLKSQVLASHSGDAFSVVVRPDTLAFTPPTATIANNASQTFAIAVLANTGEENPVPLSYAWSNTAKYGYMGDGIDGHVDNFQSSQSSVVYTANATGEGTDTITVTVSTLASPGHPSVVVGTKKATVNVAPTTSFTGSVSISPAACTQFGYTGGTITYSASGMVDNLPAGDTILYGWVYGGLSDYGGSLTVPGQTSLFADRAGHGVILGPGSTATLTVPTFPQAGGVYGEGSYVVVELFVSVPGTGPGGYEVTTTGPTDKFFLNDAFAAAPFAVGASTCDQLTPLSMPHALPTRKG